MSWTVYPRSRCLSCGIRICMIPTGDGLWVHHSDANAWGYDSAICPDTSPVDGVLQVATPGVIFQDEDPHTLHLSYTNDDDGIHLFCSCGENIPLGGSPSVHDAQVAEQDHLDGAEDR